MRQVVALGQFNEFIYLLFLYTLCAYCVIHAVTGKIYFQFSVYILCLKKAVIACICSRKCYHQF